MNRNRTIVGIVAGLGCSLVVLAIVAAAIVAFFVVPGNVFNRTQSTASAVTETARVEVVPDEGVAGQSSVATLPARGAQTTSGNAEALAALQPGTDFLTQFYDEITPGVVSVRIFAQSSFSQGNLAPVGAGSGFIIDEEGHIITNNHVVAEAERVTVVFADGVERDADIVGTDDDSDLAVLKVQDVPEDTTILPLADSDQVNEGQWVVAIGNPFGYGGSMTVGIVSAVGRTIPSLAAAGDGSTFYQIPHAIQTDAAINPGNSGGPLLNLQGEVIGVNAQIRTSGQIAANSGVGFAIPSNVVRMVAPVLIQHGSYSWPFLGVTGGPVGLAIQEANNLDTQRGAYISSVTPGTPAAEAGLRGSTGEQIIEGMATEVGGDVIVAVNGEPIVDFTDLLSRVAFSQPGDQLTLTVLRNGEQFDTTVTLASRQEFSTP